MIRVGPSQLARFKFGLRWEGDTMPKRPAMVAGLQIIAGMLALMSVLGWTQARDEADRHLARAEAAEANATRYENSLIRCLKGNHAFPIEGEMAAAWCDKATIQKL